MGRRLFLLGMGLGWGMFAAAGELVYPLSAQSFEKYFDKNPQATIETVLADLPASYRDHFVLMHTTKSLHKTNFVEPRQIFFGSDARFLLAVGGVPTDKRYSILEFGEFEPATGTYHFGTIDFRKRERPEIKTDVRGCVVCHGSPHRPVWGQYPNWAGSYSDEQGNIAVAEQAGFAAFLAKRLEVARYAGLQFNSRPDGSYFTLTARRYPFANTDLNHELGNTVALGTITRMRSQKNFDKDRFAVLATSDALYCRRTDAWFEIRKKLNPGTTNPWLKALSLLGIDGEKDLSLERTMMELKKPENSRTFGNWQTGAFRLDEAITFYLMTEIPELLPFFEKQKDLIDRTRYLASLAGEARALALRKSYAWFLFFDVFDPLIKDRKRHEEFCQLLADRM